MKSTRITLLTLVIVLLTASMALAGVRGEDRPVVTRGAATVLAVSREGERLELTPPPQAGPGTPAGCGDTMSGALAAALAMGSSWRDAVLLGVAAGSAHFAVGGAPARADVEALAGRVSVVDAG